MENRNRNLTVSKTGRRDSKISARASKISSSCGIQGGGSRGKQRREILSAHFKEQRKRGVFTHIDFLKMKDLHGAKALTCKEGSEIEMVGWQESSAPISLIVGQLQRKENLYSVSLQPPLLGHFFLPVIDRYLSSPFSFN